MTTHQVSFVHTNRSAVLHSPLTLNHHAISPTGTRQNERRKRVIMAAVPKLIELEHGKISLLTRSNDPDVCSPQTGGAAFGCQLNRIKMTEPGSPLIETLDECGSPHFVDHA